MTTTPITQIGAIRKLGKASITRAAGLALAMLKFRGCSIDFTLDMSISIFFLISTQQIQQTTTGQYR